MLYYIILYEIYVIYYDLYRTSWCPYMSSLFTGELWQCHASKRPDDALPRAAAAAAAGGGGGGAGDGKRPWMKKIQALLTRKVRRRRAPAAGSPARPACSRVAGGWGGGKVGGLLHGPGRRVVITARVTA